MFKTSRKNLRKINLKLMRKKGCFRKKDYRNRWKKFEI